MHEQWIDTVPLYFIKIMMSFDISGILVFCLPPESGEKVSLGVTVLLAMTVYQLLIADAIPPTSEVIPLIGKTQISSRFDDR